MYVSLCFMQILLDLYFIMFTVIFFSTGTAVQILLLNKFWPQAAPELQNLLLMDINFDEQWSYSGTYMFNWKTMFQRENYIVSGRQGNHC